MLPERLKQLRKEHGMTQLDLAKELGVSGGTVAMWETGKRMPRYETLDRMTDLFDRRIEYILGTSDDTSSPHLSEDEVRVLGEWAVQDDYEDVFRRFAMLDEYGQKNVEAVLRNEFIRCHEQGTLNSGKGVSISVRVRTIEDPVNEDLPD